MAQLSPSLFLVYIVLYYSWLSCTSFRPTSNQAHLLFTCLETQYTSIHSPEHKDLSMLLWSSLIIMSSIFMLFSLITILLYYPTYLHLLPFHQFLLLGSELKKWGARGAHSRNTNFCSWNNSPYFSALPWFETCP